MRRPIIAGNWKMHKTVDESVTFVRQLAPQIEAFSKVDSVVAPTFLAVPAVAEAVSGTSLAVASQQAHWEESGAYTSQISPAMLVPFVTYAIIGHSECRAYLDETDETVNRKMLALLEAGIQPIVAVGESLEQNEAGETQSFVSQQVSAALQDIAEDDLSQVIIAYEPIWAIGTGKSASGEQADQIIASAIRQTIERLYSAHAADIVRIQYGGSVKPGNMAEFISQPNIDGALVGGAALDVDSFTELVRITQDHTD